MKDGQAVLTKMETDLYGTWHRDDGVLSVFFANLFAKNKRGVAEFFAPANRKAVMGNFEYEIFIKDHQPYIHFTDLQQNEIKEYTVLQLEAGKVLRIKSSDGMVYNFTPAN